MSTYNNSRTADRLTRGSGHNIGEHPLSTLSRALIDSQGNAIVEVMLDGSVLLTRSGQTLVDSAGALRSSALALSALQPDPTSVHSPAASLDFSTITGATLVMDLDPSTGGFADRQAIASLAAKNTASVTATQTNAAYQPVYYADGGMGRPAISFGGGQMLEVTAAPVQHYFIVAQGAFPFQLPSGTDLSVLFQTGHNSTTAEYAFCLVPNSSGWNGFTGTRYSEGTISGGDANIWTNLNAVHIWEVSSNTDFPSTNTGTLGGQFGTSGRGWQGSVFRLLAFRTQITDPTVRATIYNELRRLYQCPKVVFNGDSLTAGTGTTTLNGTYYFQAMGYLQRQYTYASAGYAGYTIDQLDALVAPKFVDAINPQVLVFWGGTNDCLTSSATGYARLVTYLTNRKAANPGMRILLLTLKLAVSTAVTSYATYNVEAPKFNALLLADPRMRNGTLANGVVRVDLIPELQYPNNATYFYDGQHLTDAGYGLVAKAVAAVIDPASTTAYGSPDVATQKVFLDYTLTTAGTTGSQTINKPAFSVRFAAGASASTPLVVTNSFIGANSFVVPYVASNDATMRNAVVTSAVGSCSIYPGAAPTAETEVRCLVINPNQ